MYRYLKSKPTLKCFVGGLFVYEVVAPAHSGAVTSHGPDSCLAFPKPALQATRAVDSGAHRSFIFHTISLPFRESTSHDVTCTIQRVYSSYKK